MLELIERDTRLQYLPDQEKARKLQGFALASFEKIASHQLPNGLIPASLGRYDDEHFVDMVWIKDNARAAKSALDPQVIEYLPGIAEPAKTLYIKAIRSLLRIQAQPGQWERFQARPEPPDQDGYRFLDDRQAPAIKFNIFGEPFWDWGHNQPDNWGTLLLEAGKGIEKGWPILDNTDGQTPPPSFILQTIALYIVNLQVERLTCRSIWEHNTCWSSYSTRKIVLAGLQQMYRIWQEVENDSQAQGCSLHLSKQQLQEAIDNLSDKANERFPADYTDSCGHQSMADLASAVVLNDVDLDDSEAREIAVRITHTLERSRGCYRYVGDPWQRMATEAEWTMGKPILARYYFLQSAKLASLNHPAAAYVALNQGLKKMDQLLAIQGEYGYVPELFKFYRQDDKLVCEPNNNELAWTHNYIIEAAAAGIAALLGRNTHKTNQPALATIV